MAPVQKSYKGGKRILQTAVVEEPPSNSSALFFTIVNDTKVLLNS